MAGKSSLFGVHLTIESNIGQNFRDCQMLRMTVVA